MSGCWVVTILFTNDIVCAIPLFSIHLKNKDTICSVGLLYPRVTEMSMRQEARRRYMCDTCNIQKYVYFALPKLLLNPQVDRFTLLALSQCLPYGSYRT